MILIQGGSDEFFDERQGKNGQTEGVNTRYITEKRGEHESDRRQKETVIKKRYNRRHRVSRLFSH